MPYMFSQANEVGCTFLLDVNNELKDVAKGSIVQQLHRMFHTVPMPPGMFRVSVTWVLAGYEDLDPPHQPPGADSELKLGQCLNWPVKWPKALIRLDPVVRSQTVTPVGETAPSQAAAAPAVSADDRAEPCRIEPSSSAFVSDDCLEDLDFLARDGGFAVHSSDMPSIESSSHSSDHVPPIR